MSRLAWRPSRTTALVALVAALAGLTLAVRLPGALNDPLWADEVASARIIAEPAPRGVLQGVARSEATPAGFYALAWTTKQAGDTIADAGGPDALHSEKLSRLWAILFAMATVALVVILASRLMPLAAAGLAGFLIALGYQFVEHGKELRAYSMLTVVAAALAILLERAVEEPRRGRLLALAGLVAVGSMTHYFFMLAVVAGILWLLLLRPGRGTVYRVVAAIGIGFIPLLVWMPAFFRQAVATEDAHQWIGPFSLRRAAYVYADVFGAPAAWGDADVVARLGILAVVLVGCGVLWRTQSGRLVALLVIVPPVATGAVWLTGERVYDTRNLLVVGPFAAIAIAAAIAAIPRRPLAIAAGLAAAAVMVFLVTFELRLGRTPHDRVAAAAQELGWTPGRPLVLFGHYWQVIPLGWSLPQRPRLVVRSPSDEACPTAVVVVETAAGRRWLRSVEGQVIETRTLPFYGNTPRGRRRPHDLRVVAVSWSSELERDVRSRGAFLLRTSPAPPRDPCARTLRRR